jgi:bla regulator protein blaR1
MMLSPLLNHLWQSTAFAAVAGMLTLALRKNRARTRHWLWFAASVKFLMPFGVLAGLGAQFGAIKPVAVDTQISYALQQISQPFAPVVKGPVLSTPSPGISLVSALLAIWMFVCLAVLIRRSSQWRSVRAAVRAASPLPIEIGVKTMSSPILFEPGVFGILRPVLLLPEGIADRLDAAQLRAIVAHELCHIRRRDNLLAAIHMAVEAIFWFHPLVWWIGARLIEERERACDEEVLRLGNDPEVYAESILRACRFYLESPIACVSGVTGGGLKRRIEQIMTQRIGANLSFRRKLLLAVAAAVAVATPIAIGLVHAPAARAQQQPDASTARGFEVASIKPSNLDPGDRSITTDRSGRLSVENSSLKDLIRNAYQLRDFQISGGPAWLDADRYNIVAKPEGTPSRDQAGPNLQKLLADRFHLKFHRESKEMPVYALVVGKNGPKLKDTEGQQHGMKGGRGVMTGMGASMEILARNLSQRLERMVIDRTGLTGFYDFKLEFTPDEAQVRAPGDSTPLPAAGSSGPSLFTALQEQLGLKLETSKGPVEILEIDHAEKPSEN